MKKDIFDRIMELPLLRMLQPFYKAHKEVLLYLLFGGLTTVISIVVFWLFHTEFGLNELAANVVSWVIAVMFSFITNKTWVFRSETNEVKKGLKLMLSFYAGRVVTLLIEEAILWLFISQLRFDSMLVKIAAQVIIIVLNYFLSKLVIFKK